MPTDDPTAFTRLADGTFLLRQADGSYQPVESKTDHVRLASLTEAEIERMAESDPDHPSLDDVFWAGVEDRPAPKEAISIRLDEDILAYFRRQGRGYRTRINSVLRRYVDAHQKERS